jgi:hypothetical protein
MNLKTTVERGLQLLALRLPLRRLPSWPYLLAAIAVAALGHWLGEMEIVAPLRELSASLLADLKVLNPLNAVGAYYYNLTGCSVAYADGGVTGNCNATSSISTQMDRYGLEGFTTIFWPVVILLQTVLEVWYESGWMGRVIYVLTLPIGWYFASIVVDRTGETHLTASGERVGDTWSPIGFVMCAALTPLFAGLAALALQWLLVVILWIFGKALAAIVWAMTVAAAPLAYASQALGIVKKANALEKGHATLKGDEKE